MSLYKKSSLIFTPSGGKVDRVYIQKPYRSLVSSNAVPNVYLDFTRTTNGTAVNSDGYIETYGPNIPRFNYNSLFDKELPVDVQVITNNNPSLLIESESTNSVFYSEEADNSYWTKVDATVVANQGISLDGTLNADKLTASGVLDSYIERTGLTAGSVSFFVKNIDFDDNGKFIIEVDGVGSALFNIDGTLLSVTGGTAFSTKFPNGWTRLQFNVSSGSTIRYGLKSISGFNLNGSVLFWGFQNESSKLQCTSYIPTTTAAVNRAVDLCDQTPTSDVIIGQTEGVVYCEFFPINGRNITNTPQVVCSIISTSGPAGRIDIRLVNGKIQALGIDGGVEQFLLDGGDYSPGSIYHVAVSYKLNDSKLYIGASFPGAESVAPGTLRDTDTDCSFTSSSLDKIQFYDSLASSSKPDVEIFNTQLYKTELTDAELISLTTPIL